MNLEIRESSLPKEIEEVKNKFSPEFSNLKMK